MYALVLKPNDVSQRVFWKNFLQLLKAT